jgi:dCTP diphosphatase
VAQPEHLQAVNQASAGTESDSLLLLRDTLRRFAGDRDWDQFHSPKDLAMALVVEAAEALEHFQWVRDDESRALDQEANRKVEEELADVLICLIRLADQLGVDLLQATRRKISLNADRYPVDKARGNSRKYSDL